MGGLFVLRQVHTGFGAARITRSLSQVMPNGSLGKIIIGGDAWWIPGIVARVRNLAICAHLTVLIVAVLI